MILARRNHRRREQGQAMALGALTMAILAASMLFTLNVANATHERVRLQSHADSISYSKAVEVARAFNYFAYTNRAIAATVVSITSLHAWMTIATSVVQAWKAARWAWIIILLTEIGKICMHKWCLGLKHIGHAIKAFKSYRAYNKEYKNKKDQVKDLDKKFEDAVGSMGTYMATVHASQQSVQGAVLKNTLFTDWDDELKQTNSSKIDDATPLLLKAVNMKLFADSLDNPTPLLNGDNDDKETRRRSELQYMSNSTRYNRGLISKDWVARRGFIDVMLGWMRLWIPGMGTFYDSKHAKLDVKLALIIPFGSGSSKVLMKGDGLSRIQRSGRDSRAMDSELAIGSQEPGGLVLLMTDCADHFPSMGFWFWTARSWVRSDSTKSGSASGAHRPSGDSHDGSVDHELQSSILFGLGGKCFADGRCFMKYDPGDTSGDTGGASDPHTSLMFVRDRIDNQQFVYSTAKLNLRNFDAGSATPGAAGESAAAKQAWEIRDDGTMKFKDLDGSDVDFALTPTSDAYAISKSMVYYHRPRSWREPPNFWNPYWKAKLHPFTEWDAAAVAAMGGADAAAAGLSFLVAMQVNP